MSYVPLEKLMKHSESFYKLVIVAAMRATELAEGAPPLVKATSKKVSTIALEEIAHGKVKYLSVSETKAVSEKTEA